MNNSPPVNELEKKIAEFKDQPGFILGLDGWLLRSVPIGQRRRFLEAFEKALQIVHHPDLFQDETEKMRHQRFLQTVANAVKFLTSDHLAYDLATEDVPTKQNHFLKTQEKVEARDKEILDLERQLRVKEKAYLGLVGRHSQLETEMTTLQKEKLDLGPLARLKAYQDWQLRNTKTYTIANSGKLFVKSTKMKSIFDNRDLHEIIPRDEKDFEKLDADFSKRVMREYLTQDKMYMKLDKGVSEYRAFKVQIVGGFPALAIREFVDYQRAKIGLEVDESLSDLVFSPKILRSGRSDAQGDIAHKEVVSPFITPYFAVNMPLLIRGEQRQEGGYARYELVYVNEVREME